MRLCVRLLLLLVVAATALTGLTGVASAHRDGCHRWHSCPSDTGSYICGDLGYYSECPGGAPGVTDEPATVPEYDYEPPPRPVITDVVVHAATVTMYVQAESGSRVQVRSNGFLVSSSAGTGAPQRMQFRLPGEGSQELTVVATDASGNQSVVARRTVTVDSVAPQASVGIVPGSFDDARTQLSVSSSEAGTYVVDVTGPKHRHFTGRIASETVALPVVLPNGRYDVHASIRDVAGNVRQLARSFTVAIPAPTLVLTRADGRGLSLSAAGPSYAVGAIWIAGERAATEQPLHFGKATSVSVILSVTDGVHDVQAEVTDVQGRHATAKLTDVEVDTTPPSLTVAAVRADLKRGRIGVRVQSEPGALVTVSVDDKRVASLTVPPTGSLEWHGDAADGHHAVTVVSADAAGNSSRRTIGVGVSTPLSVGSAIVGFALLVGMVIGLIYGVRKLRRNRERIHAWWTRQRLAADDRRRLAAHRRAVAEHANIVRAYDDARRAHEQRHGMWAAEKARLQGRAEAARTCAPRLAPPGLTLKRDEQFYVAFRGSLIDQRSVNGSPVDRAVDDGEISITTTRVLFHGRTKNREWAFDKLTHLTVGRGGYCRMVVTNRQKPSGVAFANPDGPFFLGLAHAVHAGERESFVSRAEADVRRHESAEPKPPPAPPPAPAPPALNIPRQSTGVERDLVG